MEVANFLENAVKLSELAMVEPPGPSRERAMQKLHSYLTGLHDAYTVLSMGFQDLVDNANDDDTDDDDD